MWRSFGGSSGMGRGNAGAGGSGGFGGGGGGGGGGVFRTISRVSRAGMSNIQDTSSSSSKKATKRRLSLGSKATAISPNSVAISNSNLGFVPVWPLSPSSSFIDEPDWEYVDESSTETESESIDDSVFGSVPSPIEARSALFSLQHALPNSCHLDSDWAEPSMYPYGYEQNICPGGIGRVYDAFHLLQTEPSVKRMVISLSSDRAVWDAVLNNEVVQEIKEAFRKDEVIALESSSNDPNSSTSPTNVVSWIFNNMRTKFMEFLSGITNLMKEMLQPPPGDDQQEMEEFPEGFAELVSAAFMLTAIVLLVVVVTRASHA